MLLPLAVLNLGVTMAQLCIAGAIQQAHMNGYTIMCQLLHESETGSMPMF